jgi:hypothetical protein
VLFGRLAVYRRGERVQLRARIVTLRERRIVRGPRHVGICVGARAAGRSQPIGPGDADHTLDTDQASEDQVLLPHRCGKLPEFR